MIFSHTNCHKGLHSLIGLEEANPIKPNKRAVVVGSRKRGGEHFGYDTKRRLPFYSRGL